MTNVVLPQHNSAANNDWKDFAFSIDSQQKNLMFTSLGQITRQVLFVLKSKTPGQQEQGNSPVAGST